MNTVREVDDLWVIMDLVNEKNNLFIYFGDKEGKFH